MKIKPLTGHVLVEIIPPNKISDGGIEIPERSLSPEEVQQRHPNPEKPKPITGIVREIGSWPKTKNGMLQMPEFGKGAKVLIGALSGIHMQRHIGERFKMVRLDDVLAVLT